MCQFSYPWDFLWFDVLESPINVSTPVGEDVIVTHIYRTSLILFMSIQTWVFFVILGLYDFDIILGMTLLSPHNVLFNCNV